MVWLGVDGDSSSQDEDEDEDGPSVIHLTDGGGSSHHRTKLRSSAQREPLSSAVGGWSAVSRDSTVALRGGASI